jgi:hypothetical protein
VSQAELRVFLHLLMVSDPWPLEEEGRLILTDFADNEARNHGFTDWIDAYHKL